MTPAPLPPSSATFAAPHDAAPATTATSSGAASPRGGAVVERIPAVLDVAQLARLLNMTEAGARRLCRSGAIRATIPAGTRCYRVRGADVLAWLEGPSPADASPAPTAADAVAHLRGLVSARRRRRILNPMPTAETVWRTST